VNLWIIIIAAPHCGQSLSEHISEKLAGLPAAEDRQPAIDGLTIRNPFSR
jgi:hypothetical protein